MRFVGVVSLGLVSLLLSARPAMAQQAAWLDGPLDPWNVVGMSVPLTPQNIGSGPLQCQARVRPAAGAEESAVASAGWQLTLDWPAQRRGETVVVMATADFDGMCRPLGFNAFVFEVGRFAGTIAPEPMGARSDGTLLRPPVFLPDGRLDASYARFASFDPLCCPSRPPTRLLYRVEQRGVGPVLIAERPSAPASGMRLPSTGGGPNPGDEPASGQPCSTVDPSDERCSTD